MIPTELCQAVADRRVILFVGSGVSATLGVATWRGLIGHMAKEIGFDPDLVEPSPAAYLTLAEYYRIQNGSLGSIRTWMQNEWSRSDVEVGRSRVHQLIVELNFPLIYTTNYDPLLEQAHKVHGKPFYKVADVRGVRDAAPDKTQIIKLHGDFDDDETMVLTETDYFNRLSFESPLDIKLRADSLGRAILFIGYSLSDINIRLMLYKLSQLWKLSPFEKHQPRSYLFQDRPNPIQEAVLHDWGVDLVTVDADDPANALTQFLESLRPAR